MAVRVDGRHSGWPSQWITAAVDDFRNGQKIFAPPRCGWHRRSHKPPHPLQVAAIRLENMCENICPEPEGRLVVETHARRRGGKQRSGWRMIYHVKVQECFKNMLPLGI